jgi:hypothetical protein
MLVDCGGIGRKQGVVGLMQCLSDVGTGGTLQHAGQGMVRNFARERQVTHEFAFLRDPEETVPADDRILFFTGVRWVGE